MTYVLVDWIVDIQRFAAIIKNARVTLGFSQNEVGEYIGRSGAYIGKLERAWHPAWETMSLRDFVALCNMLDTDPRGFFVLAS